MRSRISKFSEEMTRERWLLLLLIGVLSMILSFPLPGSRKEDKGKENQTATDSQGLGAVPLWIGDARDPAQTRESPMFGLLDQDHMGGGSSENSEGDLTYPASASPGGEGSYETQMENRIRNLLESVDGMGKVDVTVVLESSSEKVVRIGRFTSSSTTREKSPGGGTREVANSQLDESTVLSGSGSSGSGNVPIIKREPSPKISGIIVSAGSGGGPTVRAETSRAMEALFDLPPHKIKVLRRVE